MIRIALILTGFFVTIMPAFSADSGRPTGMNCGITEPPTSAGEDMNHNVVLRIFPRAKDIDSAYTGCQVVLAPEGEKWVVLFLTEIVNGDPIGLWSEEEDDPPIRACRYRNGKVVEGDSAKCPVPESLLVKSVAPGCTRIIQEAIAKHGLGAPRPKQCEYE